MSQTLTIQGRPVGPAELQALRQWIVEHPDWSRWRLSRELAARWNWRNGVGALKDMAVRSLLVKLDQRGLVVLPERRQVPTNRMRCPVVAHQQPGQTEPVPIQANLAELGVLTVQEISGQADQRAWVKRTLSQFHYLGFGGPVGENLQYVITDPRARPLACLVFGAAAWKCQDRDRFIGWSGSQRQKHLALVANNTRFLIFPWVQVPGLGSWILGQVSRQIAQDWQAKYGHPVVLLESFVQSERFRGTVYRAANWVGVGQTTGRTRQDRHTCIQAPVKEIYLYPLRRSFREQLCA